MTVTITITAIIISKLITHGSGFYTSIPVLPKRDYGKPTKKLDTGLRTFSAGIPFAFVLWIEAIGFPTFGASTGIIFVLKPLETSYSSRRSTVLIS